MTTIYRKYRPQTFAEVVGQEHIITTLMNEVAGDQLAGGYLFSGPRGTGKTTLARLLAKAANCYNREKGKSEPCEACSSCQEITSSHNIDVIEVDAASHTGVDNVREHIIENAQFKPTKSAYKIFIIDEVHMLSTSSFNALLKIVEEPPAHVIFILATTELHKIPATIVSRCQRFAFRKIPYETMRERLEKICAAEKITVEKSVLNRIIVKSEGCLRDAESLLGQIFSLNLTEIKESDTTFILPSADNNTIFAFLQTVLTPDLPAGFNLLSTLAEEGFSFDQFALNLIETVRALLIIHSAGPLETVLALYSQDEKNTLLSLAKKCSSAELVRLLDACAARRRDIKTSPIPQLPLELLLVEFCLPQDTAINPSVKKTESFSPPTPPAPIEKKMSAPLTTPPPSSQKPAEKIVLSEEAPRPAALTSALSLAEAKAGWENFIQKLGETSHALTFVLKMCTLENVEANSLSIKVPYQFHQEKLAEFKNKKLIDTALFSVYQRNLSLDCHVVAAPVVIADDSSSLPENDLMNLAAQFGGEVVG